MTQTDLRSFLAAIEASGGLVATDQEVDWDLEACARGRLTCEKDGPAILFRRVKDYGSDVPVLVNLPRRPRADARAVGRWLVSHG